MPFVVTEPCIQCKYTDRVSVPECPVGTIVNAAEVTDDQRPFIELNERLAQHPDWKPIKTSKPLLPGHAQWASVAVKRELLRGD